MLNCEFGVVDVNIHVDCGDGTCVPAEISVSKGSLRQGLSEEFDAVIWINLKRYLKFSKCVILLFVNSTLSNFIYEKFIYSIL